jgi:lipid-A-disaccharide synthase
VTRLRIGVVAGEPSGDALGAQVLAALGKRCEVVLAEGVGGSRMEAEGMVSLYPVERLAVMGLVEPLKRLPELLRINRALGSHFVRQPPDVFLGIDAPDFNLRLEKRLRRAGITTAHLVSPSVWAWRRRRLPGIARAVDLMLCLFPFETDIYRRHGLPVRHVGHPLADEIDPDVDRLSMRRQLGLEPEGPLLALLPGSREAEVRLLAPVFLQAARLLRQENPRLTLAIPAAGRERHAQLQEMLAAFDDLPVRLIPGQSREVMAAADAVLLASGTATLEAALLRRPMVVAYRMGEVSWWLLSRLVRTPYVALPNLLAGRLLVPELLQKAATPDALAAAVQPLLAGNEAADRQLQGFGELRGQLGQGAADAVASALLELAGAAGTHGG